MKKFTQFNEAVINNDNPGNDISRSVAGHYTPIQNIITNVRNLYAGRAGIIVSEGEDGVSLKMTSSKFTDKHAIMKVLGQVYFQQGMTLAAYIQSQGLNDITLVDIGKYYIVYFSPSDMATATHPGVGAADAPERPHMNDSLMPDVEYEISHISEAASDDEELEDECHRKICDVIADKDKIKGAKTLHEIVSKEQKLPDEIYCSGVRDMDGNESIALRWKFTKNRPQGKTQDMTRSVMNIYGPGDDAVWVGDFDRDSIVKLPDSVEDTIRRVLGIIGADETENPAVFAISPEGGLRRTTGRKPGKDKDKDKDGKPDGKRGTGKEGDDVVKVFKPGKGGQTDQEGNNIGQMPDMTSPAGETEPAQETPAQS